MQRKQVKDLMLPLSEYAVVNEDATLLEALKILEAAQAKLPPGKFLHRAVLVSDSAGQIVGRLGHHGFLEAFEPKYTVLGDVQRLSKAGLSEAFVHSIMDSYQFWQDGVEDVCRRARTVKIKEVMKPIAVHIEESSSLPEAIHKLVMWQTLSMLVTRGEEVVGILRLSDVFRVVTSFIKSEECVTD